MNHLDAHIGVVRSYLGVHDSFYIGVEYQEFGDARHAASLETVAAAVPCLTARLAGPFTVAGPSR